MQKRYLTQIKKQRFSKLTTSFCFLSIVIIGTTFIIMALQNWIVLSTWESGGVKEYYGLYTLTIKEYVRNTNYIFSLPNGDNIEIPCEAVSNGEKLENIQSNGIHHELVFRYMKYRKPLRNTYSVVSINSGENGTVYVDERVVKSNMVGELVAYVVLAFICFSPIILYGYYKLLLVRK